MNTVNEIQGLFETGGKPKIFELKFDILRPVVLEVTLADPMRPNTAWTCREETFKSPKNNEVWQIRLPITSEVVVVSVKINRPEPIDTYVKMDGLTIYDYKVPKPYFNDHAKAFFEFVTKICSQMGYLPANRTYISDDQYKFEIELVDAIPDGNGGVHPTPARIHTELQYIQENLALMRPKPVARRIAINAHEYSHEWRNTNPDSEFQADWNGAYFFDQLGWNSWDYVDSFTKSFETASKMIDMNNPAVHQNFLINKHRERIIKNRYNNQNFLSR